MLEFARKEQRLLQVLVTFKTEFTRKFCCKSWSNGKTQPSDWLEPYTTEGEHREKEQKAKGQGRHIWKKEQIYDRQMGQDSWRQKVSLKSFPTHFQDSIGKIIWRTQNTEIPNRNFLFIHQASAPLYEKLRRVGRPLFFRSSNNKTEHWVDTLHEELRRSLASFGSVMMISFEV